MAPHLAPTSERAPIVDLSDESANHQRIAPTTGITLSDEGSLRERAQCRRYLQPDFRCLCCKRRSSRASARTRYLQRCLRRTGTDVTHVTCVYPLLAAALDVSRLIRTVRRRHVTAAEPLVTGTFSMGTSDNRRYARQPGRPDGWLAPRQTGCSASGHSRSPTALPTLWICW
jgi:hypothetical protein